jgi:hypothetical protein
MAWAALLIGLGTGAAIFIGTITTLSDTRAALRSWIRTRRQGRAPDAAGLETFSDLRDELVLQARLARDLSRAAGANGELDATLDEFRRASEAFIELAEESRGSSA